MQSRVLRTWYKLTRARPPLTPLRPLVDRALDATRKLENSPFKAATMRDVGYMLFLTGDLEGLWVVEEAAALAQELGDLSCLSLCYAALMLIYRHTGRPDRGVMNARRYRDLLAVTGNRVELILVELAVAMLEAVRGNAAAARAAFEAAPWTKSPGAFMAEQREMTLAWLYVAEGRYSEAAAQAVQAERRMRGGGENFIYVMEARLAGARAAVEANPATARKPLERLKVGAGLTPHLEVSSLDVEARLHELEGRPGSAADLWAFAITRAQELECPLPERRCHAQLARLWAESAPERAARELEAVRELDARL